MKIREIRSFLFLAFSLSIHLLLAQAGSEQVIEGVLLKGTVREVLKSVEEHSDFSFVYDSRKLDGSRSVELPEGEYTLDLLLKTIFRDDQVEFLKQENSIILKTKSQKKPIPKGKATIHGYIIDDRSSENLLGASIVDLKNGLGTMANYYGYYSLTLPAEEVDLEVSFVGMEKQRIHFDLKKDTALNVRMRLGDLTLDEIVVVAEEEVSPLESTEMGVVNLSRKQIQSRPAIGGEVDVIKTLQLLPGVQSGVEGSARLYVRGGGPDQNLILLDGVPVYNTSHLFGFSSVFNSDAINNVKLIKGAFPARYGGRLSSVLDMSMREGNNKKIGGVLNISPIASSLMLEGPIVKEKSSFMVAARRSFIDLVTNPFTDNSYFFKDVNFKINHRFSDRDRVYFSSYWGRDLGKLNEHKNWEEGVDDDWIFSETRTRSHVDWGSGISLVRWNHVFNPKLFANLSLSYSTYDFEATNDFFSETKSKRDTLTEYQKFVTTSEIKDWGAKLDFDFFPAPNHSVKWGVQLVSHEFKPNVVGLIASEEPDVKFNANSLSTREYNFYVEDDFKISNNWLVNAGVHASGLEVQDKFYTSFQPRLSLAYTKDDWALKASYADMTQFLHLLTNPGLGLPTDLWVPATSKVPPQQSTQYSLGVVKSFASLGLECSVEGYYKQMDGLIEYKDGANFLRLNEDWQDKVNIGSGVSYGVEWFVSRKWNQFEGWLGYTLAWSDRQFDEINFGRKFPYKYDRRHDINAVLTHHIKKNIHLSANWVYGTGIALTLPSGKYRTASGVIGEEHWSEPTPVLDFQSRNGYRQRASHRLDLSASWVKKNRRTERTWIFTVYNAYNHRNPVFVEVRPTQDFNGLDWNLRFKEYSFLSIIPSVTYCLTF